MASCDVTLPDQTVLHDVYGVLWKRGLTTESHVLSGGQDKKWTVFTWDHDGAADAPYPTNPRVKDATVNDDQGNHRRTSGSYQPFTPPLGGALTLPQQPTQYTADASH